jgi:hypothetical protein
MTKTSVSNGYILHSLDKDLVNALDELHTKSNDDKVL